MPVNDTSASAVSEFSKVSKVTCAIKVAFVIVIFAHSRVIADDISDSVAFEISNNSRVTLRDIDTCP